MCPKYVEMSSNVKLDLSALLAKRVKKENKDKESERGADSAAAKE